MSHHRVLNCSRAGFAGWDAVTEELRFLEEEVMKEVFASSPIVLALVEIQLPCSNLPFRTWKSCVRTCSVWLLCATESPGSEAVLDHGACAHQSNSFLCVYAPGWCLCRWKLAPWLDTCNLRVSAWFLSRLPAVSSTKEKHPSQLFS